MPEISSLTRVKPVEAVLDLGGGDVVNMTFNANAITPAWISKAQEGLANEDQLALPKALSEAIITWDVTQDNGLFQPTADNIAVFSFPAMSVFFEAIMEAAVPGVAEGNASLPSVSEPPSVTSDKVSQSSLNGSDTSTSQTSSAAPLVT